MWELNRILQNKRRVNEEISEEIKKKKYFETKLEIQHSNLRECSKSSFKRKVHSDKCLPQEMRKISNNLTLYLKEVEKEEQMKPKGNRSKEVTEWK